MFRKSTKTGNVLSAIESQGYRLRRASATGYLKLLPDPSGKGHQRLNDTSSRKTCLGRKNGQPDGSAVTGKAGKLWVAETDLVSAETAGQNNSNLTS